MKSISKKSRITIYVTTLLWCAIMTFVCAMLYFKVEISNYHSYYILHEFSKAIALWYVFSIACACILDLNDKKRGKT